MRLLVLLILIFLAQTLGAAIAGVFGSEYVAKGLCGPYPRVEVTTPPWSCLGIVAGPDHGFIWPRSIVQVADNRFIVTDMVGWYARGQGRIFSLTVGPDGTVKVSTLYSDHNLPDGLAVGPDGYVYVGDDDRIWRFDPEHPSRQPETLLKGLPDKRSRGGDHWHPLKRIIFDKNGDLIVNMGAPNDGCQAAPGSSGQWPFPCPFVNSSTPDAALWRLQFDWTTRKAGDFSPLARGLRNSVALAVAPKSGLLFQAENGIDSWDGRTERDQPPDELNIILPGRHYGWPYCAGLGTVVPGYRFKIKSCAAYEPPYMLLPAHAAPLGMIYYRGAMFPELAGKLLIAFHGFREHGHRIVAYDVDEDGKPLVRPNKSAAVVTTIIDGWTRVPGLRPMGRPASLVEAKDGAIWFIDDKARTVMVMLRSSGRRSPKDMEPPLAARVSRVASAKPAGSPTSFAASAGSPPGWASLYQTVLRPRCEGCHEEMRNDDADEAWQSLVARGLADPENPGNSAIIRRMLPEGPGTPMPIPSGLQAFPEDFLHLKSFIEGLSKGLPQSKN